MFPRTVSPADTCQEHYRPRPGTPACRQASAQGFGHNMGVPYLRQPFIATIHRLKVGDNPSVSSRESAPGRIWV